MTSYKPTREYYLTEKNDEEREEDTKKHIENMINIFNEINLPGYNS